MSIINQMLQKLEQRRGGRDASLPEGVRAVATATTGRRPLMLVVLAAILAAGGGYYGWTVWQLRSKPAKSVAVAGKIPGSPPQKVAVPEQPSKAEEEKQLAEIAQKMLEESLKQPEKPDKSESSSKKTGSHGEKRIKDTALGENGSGAPREAKPGMDGAEKVGGASHEPVKKSFPTIGASRESTGKIRLVARDTAAQERAMKSMSPQQQALFHYQKALSFLQQGRVAEARSGLEEALKLDPHHLAARQALAGLMVEQRQYHQAELLMQEGLNLNTEQYGFAMALARLQVERGDVRAALDTLHKSLPSAVDNAGYQAFLAALLQRAEQHKKAIEHYQAALRLASSGAWQMGLGISLQAEGKLAEAQEAFGQAKISNELTSDLSTFVEQRLRMIKKLLHTQVLGDAK